MPKKRPRLGNLPPLYNFFLNPYADARFSRCPQCEGKTGQKKVPLLIHVDPHYPVNLNYTCRYCAKCDILIAHRDEIENFLAQIFATLAPEAIGHDYLVMGTTDRNYWKDGVDNPRPPTDTLENLHDFKDYLNFDRIGGWSPNASTPWSMSARPNVVETSEPSGKIDNVKNAKRLVAKMEESLPITVRAGIDLLKMLHKQGFPISDRQTLAIKKERFLCGDEMGIACDITPPGKHKQAVVCSLTHLEILGTALLADEMRAYQDARKQSLAGQGEFGLQDFAISRKR